MLNKKAQITETTGRILLIALVIILIFFLIGSFRGDRFAIVSLEAIDKIRGGDIVDYNINLRTVDPEQFRTSVHFREQFGSWRLEDSEGDILFQSNKTKLIKGIYNIIVTLETPKNHSVLFLIGEIAEVQNTASTQEGPFLASDEIIRETETLTIEILSCQEHTDCNMAGTCLGQFGFCQNNLCEVQGDCQSCAVDTECVNTDKEFQCSDNICEEIIEPTLVQSLQAIFEEPITEPGAVEPGQPLEERQASPILSGLTLILFLAVLFIISQKKQ